MAAPRNPVLDAIENRRSIRRFSAQAVSKEDILAVLEAGRWAPSGLNNQPWCAANHLLGSECIVCVDCL